MRIRVSWDDGEIFGQLADTPTGKAVYAALPCTAEAHTWGEEVYFDLAAKAELAADATDVVERGTICYWVEGQCLALPFGPTPASREGECRLATRVNQIGTLEGDLSVMASVKDGAEIKVEAVQ